MRDSKQTWIHWSILTGLFLLIVCPSGTCTEDPWTFSTASPVPQVRTNSVQRTTVRSTASHACGLWLSFYQKHLTAIMRSKCVMVPSCSAYSRKAIGKHGVLIGIIMSSDRLLHEGDEYQTSEAVKTGTRVFFLDALENNDFWWTQ